MKVISIIIPSKNRFEYTAQALSSIYRQKIPKGYKLEVIVVDDLSSPTLKSVLGKKFNKVIFVKNKAKIHGPGSSRNVGLKKAKGEYIAFLDNDDQWKQDFVSNSLTVLENTAAPASLCLTDEFFDGKFNLFYKIKIKLLNYARLFVLIFCSLFLKKKLPQSGFYLAQLSHMIFKKNAIKNISFDTSLAAGEDMKFVVEVTKKKTVHIVPRKLVLFRYEPKSNTQSEMVRKNKWNSYKEVLKFLPKVHKQGLLYYLFLKYIRIFES